MEIHVNFIDEKSCMIAPSTHPASMYFPQSEPDGHLLASLIKTLIALVSN